MVIISAGCLLRSISFYTPVRVGSCWDWKQVKEHLKGLCSSLRFPAFKPQAAIFKWICLLGKLKMSILTPEERKGAAAFQARYCWVSWAVSETLTVSEPVPGLVSVIAEFGLFVWSAVVDKYCLTALKMASASIPRNQERERNDLGQLLWKSPLQSYKAY